MKEDKLDKQIAASLKKHLGEASVPYELGAWEGFQKKRRHKKYKEIAMWATSIAASIALLLFVANAIDYTNGDGDTATQLATKIGTEQSLSSEDDSTVIQKDSIEKRIEEIILNPLASKDQKNSKVDQSESRNVNDPVLPSKKRGKDSVEVPLRDLREVPVNSEQLVVELPNVESQSAIPVNQRASAGQNIAESVIEEEAVAVPKKQVIEQKAVPQEQVIEQKVLPQEQVIKPTVAETAPVQKEVAPVQKEVAPPAQNPQTMISEAEFPEISKAKTEVNLGMGVSPGFGMMQAENTMTSASSIGVGMLVDVNLPGKFVLGSGLGVNYLNQVNEIESLTMAYGNSYPQTDKIEVRQMQLEVPVFVKYPVTRNNSVSIQAGFSNFYSLNQKADQKSEYTAQVPMFSDANSFSIVKQNIQESTPLETNNGKFYPFATLNLGVNLRVLETSGANYYIMPFYNYQVRQISGYGNTYGLFGASFKMNFGGGGK